MMIAQLILVVLVACASMVAQASTCPIPGPELPACSHTAGCITDIRQGGSNPDPMLDPRLVLMRAVGTDNMTVRLGPDVDLDFSGLADCLFPIYIGRRVALTSVASFEPAPGRPMRNPQARGAANPAAANSATASNATTGGASTGTTTVAPDSTAASARREGEFAGNLNELEVESPTRIGSARTPRSLGPVLRYGKHRADSPAFFENRCFAGVLNEGMRISGFRMLGPTFDHQGSDEVGILITRCADVEISNMEIAGWGGAAITINDHRDEESGFGDRILGPQQVKIYGNFLHHNQHPTDCNIGGNLLSGVGLADCHAGGYGVTVGHGAWAQITENVFDFNRHSIATPGDVGGYRAERNLVLKGGGYHGGSVNSYTHQFDVHGTGCAWSSDLCGDAGRQFWYYRNAFQYSKDYAIKIRGKPELAAFIDDNVFPHPGVKGEAVHLNTDENVQLGSKNVTSFDSYGQYGVCDFDGDGVDDLFLATGRTWWYSSYGEFHWSWMNNKDETLAQVRLGYFDDDARCDVLAEYGGRWMISSGGYGQWQAFTGTDTPLKDVVFGRFGAGGFTGSNGAMACGVVDHRNRPRETLHTTHAFRRRGDGQWHVRALSGPDQGWQAVQSSSLPMEQLSFGDFNGDGQTDVLAVVGGRWSISQSARCPWRRINPNLGNSVKALRIANMDADDSIDDVLRLEQTFANSGFQINTTLTWWRSKNGTGPWTKFKSYNFAFFYTADTMVPALGFVGRFGAAPGGATLVIDQDRKGRFFSPAEVAAGAQPDWTSLFSY